MHHFSSCQCYQPQSFHYYLLPLLGSPIPITFSRKYRMIFFLIISNLCLSLIIIHITQFSVAGTHNIRCTHLRREEMFILAHGFTSYNPWSRDSKEETSLGKKDIHFTVSRKQRKKEPENKRPEIVPKATTTDITRIVFYQFPRYLSSQSK